MILPPILFPTSPTSLPHLSIMVITWGWTGVGVGSSYVVVSCLGSDVGRTPSVLLLEEFDLEIKNKKGIENSVVEHLSRLHIPSAGDISDSFPDEHLLAILSHSPWFSHIVNFIVTGSIPEHWNHHQRDKFFHDLKYYFREEPLLFHLGYDQIIRRCIPKE